MWQGLSSSLLPPGKTTEVPGLGEGRRAETDNVGREDIVSKSEGGGHCIHRNALFLPVFPPFFFFFC